MRTVYIHRPRGTGVEGICIRGIVHAFRERGSRLGTLSATK